MTNTHCILTRSASIGVVSIMLMGSMTACSLFKSEPPKRADYLQPSYQSVDPVAPLVLRVVGYGVGPQKKDLNQQQKNLLALRASKMDAYRMMAERVYGLKVQGSTTVKDMIVQNDRFKSYVETYMHGARVVSSDMMKDGTVETIMEMVVDQGFRNCLSMDQDRRTNASCQISAKSRDEDLYVIKQQRQRISGELENQDQSYFLE